MLDHVHAVGHLPIREDVIALPEGDLRIAFAQQFLPLGCAILLNEIIEMNEMGNRLLAHGGKLSVMHGIIGTAPQNDLTHPVLERIRERRIRHEALIG